jgi:hypothetical protein
MRYTLNIDSKAYALGKEHHLVEHKPSPAEEHLPEWFKGLKYDERGATAKSCRGVYDMATSGFMVVWPFDVTITKDEEGKIFMKRTRANDREEVFHPHPHYQLGQYPDVNLAFQKFGVEKVVLPYRLKTPKGTSLMMIQPPYRPELKTEVMPGILDTDKFYSPLNVLFTMKHLETNRDVKIQAGTPLAQLIPFVRSEWVVDHGPIDDRLLQVTEENTLFLDRYYQKKLWTRKFFKRKGN